MSRIFETVIDSTYEVINFYNIAEARGQGYGSCTYLHFTTTRKDPIAYLRRYLEISEPNHPPCVSCFLKNHRHNCRDLSKKQHS